VKAPAEDVTRGSNEVSLVIVNKNERALEETLRALRSDVGERLCEVIVVDASNFGLDDIRKANEWVHWIDYVQPAGIRTTIAHQRNVGVKVAIGGIIVFTDSGCLPEEGWLEKLLAPILNGDEFVACGPAVSTGKSVYSGAHWSGDVSDDYVSVAPTINLAFRRQAFDSVGGFDESFGSAEDLDFTWRLVDKGYRLRWVKDAVVTHDWGSPQRQLRRAFFYGEGACRLLHKHPNRIMSATRSNPVPVVYALFIVGLPLTLKWRWYPLMLLWPIWRQRKEEIRWLVLMDHLAMGAGVLRELVRSGS
jgi:GT2 family glycosyltransferase